MGFWELSALFLANKTALSDAHMKIAPTKKPIVATTYAGKSDCSFACSIAGCNRDQKLAAIITPEAKPNIIFRIVLFCSLNINFPNIIRQAQMTDNGLALAELIDKVEKTMDDMEVIKNMVEMNNEVIHKKIEEIKKQKSIQER